MTIPRVLVDISALWNALDSIPVEVWDIERQMTMNLLRMNTVCALPVVYDRETLYVLDRQLVSVWLSSLLRSRPTAQTEQSSRLVNGGAELAGARKLARKSRSIVGRALVRLTPERSKPDLRLAMHHAESAIRLWLRPPAPESHLSDAGADRPGLSLAITPGPGDVICTFGPSPGCGALRWMAEVKPAFGFRVVSICLGIDGVATIDQLDAADVIVCGSSLLREQLGAFALASRRPIPSERVFPVEPDMADTNWIADVAREVWGDRVDADAMVV